MPLRSNVRAGLAGMALALSVAAVWLVVSGPEPAEPSHLPQVPGTGLSARSLEGTVPDGLAGLQAGALNALPTGCREAGCGTLAYGELKRLFDYYLSTVGEQSIAAITAEIQQVLTRNLSAGQLPQALRLLDRYIAFRQDILRLEQGFAAKPSADRTLRARFQAMLEIRARHFSAEEAQAMLGLEDAQDLDALARLDVANDATLGAAERQSRLQAIDQQMPKALREERDAPRSVIQLEERVAALRGQGAGDDEIFRTRAKALDTAAASRLAAVDQEERAWRSRMDAYLAERVRLLARLDNAPESEKTTALAALQTENFSELERKRLAAYEP